MALRNIIQEVKEGVGGLSRRSFESRKGRLQHSSMEIQREDLDKNENEQRNAVGWGNMMPELLTEIIERVEASQSVWPDRKNVVACACVCKSWRTITKHIVKPPHQCAKFTFPQALKQPGPLDPPMQCYIRRDKVTSTYYLYLGLTPTFADKGKFLLAARRFRHPVSTEYVISLDADDFSQGSNAYMGKLSSDFLGTKFTIYDSEAPHNGAQICSNRAGRRVASKQVSPRVPAGSYNVGQVSYKFNLLGSRGPRRMHCALHSMACLSTILAESASTSKKTNEKDTSAISEVSTNNLETIELQGAKNGSMILKNKAPRWHEQLQCWCLNFHGRVTVASVKNFQLVAAVDPTRPGLPVDQDIVLLQFGKVGKDMFTMDYRQPLSAFQAFAICLTSFGTKLACE